MRAFISRNNALAQREAVTPALLALLDDALVNPQRYAGSGGSGPFYAVALLAQFAEPAAHERIVALAKLPEDQSDGILGDGITEFLSIWLWQTHGTRLDGIKELFLARNAYPYCRSAAAGALVYAVTLGLQSRDEILTLLAGQLSNANWTTA